jgi:hypothetical protein
VIPRERFGALIAAEALKAVALFSKFLAVGLAIVVRHCWPPFFGDRLTMEFVGLISSNRSELGPALGWR